MISLGRCFAPIAWSRFFPRRRIAAQRNPSRGLAVGNQHPRRVPVARQERKQGGCSPAPLMVDAFGRRLNDWFAQECPAVRIVVAIELLYLSCEEQVPVGQQENAMIFVADWVYGRCFRGEQSPTVVARRVAFRRIVAVPLFVFLSTRIRLPHVGVARNRDYLVVIEGSQSRVPSSS